MQIFISYAREDYGTARRLFEALKSIPAVEPWLDQENLLPGAAWEEEILRAIDESRFIILLLSHHSIEKDGFVQREIAEALDRFSRIPPGDIFLIPARIADCVPRHRKLKELNWVDLFPDWDEGIARIARAVLENQPTNDSLEEFVSSITHVNPKALPIIQSHPRGGEILHSMYLMRTNKAFPRLMSVDGELVHNPIYEQGSRASGASLRPLMIGGAFTQHMRLLLLDLYLIKAFDNNGQPMLLQYYSGTHSAGWKTWLFPHGLGFQRTTPNVLDRMRLNARDFEVTTGLPPGSTSIEYAPRSEFLVSIKPDFGYRHELVFYCFLFCSVVIETPPAQFLQREFQISRGDYPRRFRWFYFEELQNNKDILAKNSDIIKAIHTIHATSLVQIEPSLDVPVSL